MIFGRPVRFFRPPSRHASLARYSPLEAYDAHPENSGETGIGPTRRGMLFIVAGSVAATATPAQAFSSPPAADKAEALAKPVKSSAPIELGANGRIIARHLQDHYPMLRPHHTAAILGNMFKESGFDPKARKGPFVGLCQWGNPRNKHLTAFAAAKRMPHNDLIAQTDFVMHELGLMKKGASGKPPAHFGTERAVQKPFLAANNLEKACRVFTASYERPANRKFEIRERLKIAQALYPQIEKSLEPMQKAGAERPSLFRRLLSRSTGPVAAPA